MKMKRIVVATVAGLGLGTAGFASASALNLDGGTIQYGQSGVSCDTDGVDTSWGLETDDNSVRSVRIENIAAACAGDKLFVKVDNGATKSATIAGTSVSFPLGTAGSWPTADSITDIKVWIEG